MGSLIITSSYIKSPMPTRQFYFVGTEHINVRGGVRPHLHRDCLWYIAHCSTADTITVLELMTSSVSSSFWIFCNKQFYLVGKYLIKLIRELRLLTSQLYTWKTSDELYNITSRVVFKSFESLTLRWLMSYIYGAPILDVSRSHTTTQHSR